MLSLYSLFLASTDNWHCSLRDGALQHEFYLKQVIDMTAGEMLQLVSHNICSSPAPALLQLLADAHLVHWSLNLSGICEVPSNWSCSEKLRLKWITLRIFNQTKLVYLSDYTSFQNPGTKKLAADKIVHYGSVDRVILIIQSDEE